MENDQNCTPPELREVAEGTLSNLLPTKSREVYEKEFANFEAWYRERGRCRAYRRMF
jgi:predicted phosphoadenosine phosphosulfate sulfurtransferase